MIDTVTTLQISPVSEPHLGLALMPFLMEMLGNSLSLSKVLALNIHGLKYNLSSPQSEKLHIAQNYLAAISMLGISPDHVWRDDLNEFGAFAQTAFTDLLSRGLLKIGRRSIAKCPCGKVEFLEGSSSFSIRRRLFRESDGLRICKLCDQVLRIEDVDVCLFPCSPLPERFHAVPSFMEQELRNLALSLSGVEYLVSRTRVTHFSLNLPNLRDFDIDPDFLWSLVLPYLHATGHTVQYVIGSQRNLLACFLVGMLAQAFPGLSDPVFVIPPYLIGPRHGNMKMLGSIESLVGKVGADVIRVFLLGGLNWNKKESILDPKYLDYLASLQPTVLTQALRSVLPASREKITTMNGINLRKEIVRLQKG